MDEDKDEGDDEGESFLDGYRIMLQGFTKDRALEAVCINEHIVLTFFRNERLEMLVLLRQPIL
jgi:hypothetical protein